VLAAAAATLFVSWYVAFIAAIVHTGLWDIDDPNPPPLSWRLIGYASWTYFFALPVALLVAAVVVRRRLPGRYRWRTAARRHLPPFLLNLGIAAKGRRDCGDHDWYRATDDESRCYHCELGVRPNLGDR
jgi:hypothetical protein